MVDINYFNQLKALHWKQEIESILDGYIPEPVTVEIDPSNTCNHACPHCFYTGYRQKNNVQLSKQVLFNLIEQLIDLDVKSITFTGGGEPLTNKHTIPAIIKFGDRIDIGLVTNGGLLSGHEQNVANCCKYVRISLDAATKEMHEELHKSSDFNKIIQSIKKLVEEKKDVYSEIHIGVTFLINKINYNEIIPFAKLMRNLGVDFIYYRPVLDWKQKFDSSLIATITDALEVVSLYETKDFKVFINYPRIKEATIGKKPFKSCLSTPLISVIGADGNVYLCCQFRGFEEFSLGNINTSKFIEIWHGKKHEELIHKIDISRCPPCRNGTYNEIIERCFINDELQKNFL